MLTNAFGQAKTGVNFAKPENWEATVQMAKDQKKSIFVDVFTTWCAPCKMMDQNVFTSPVLAKFLDSTFICIKVQMDSTAADNQHVKTWRTLAKKLEREANIAAFPTQLYYDSNGKLIFKIVGYQNSDAIIRIGRLASQPSLNKSFTNNLLAYQNGEREYKKMPELAETVRDLLGDLKLTQEIALEYKRNYLDKLSEKEFMQAKNLKFIADNGSWALIDSKDVFFKFAYRHPSLIDSILGKDASKYYVANVITREIIDSRLYEGDKVLITKPNWRLLARQIKGKFSKIDPDEIILDAKVRFYSTVKDWNEFTYFKSLQIEARPPIPGTMDVFFTLNDVAWNVFLNTSSQTALKRALSWSELSIKLEGNNVQYLDTKANLLYKLKRIKEALEIQELAFSIDKANAQKSGNEYVFKYIGENLEKMRKGIPTWL